MFWKGIVRAVILGLAILHFPDFALAEEAQARIYTTSEERRDAGIKHEITDWLTVAGLVEAEYLSERFDVSNEASFTTDNFSTTFQLGIEISPLSWVKAELVYEYDDETGIHKLDEALASFEAGDFEFEFGRLYVPFGLYFSHFASGPLLEFGETRTSAALLSYGSDERLDVTAFVYRGKAKKVGSSDRPYDWGFAVDGSPADFVSLGLSYISDIADSDEGFLSDDGDRYERRVAGLSSYAVIGNDRMEMSAEYVRALRAFKELDQDRDQPRAWNIEFSYFPRGNFEWALRLEGSKEFEDAPRIQTGASFTWRITRNASFTVDYLQGKFRRGLAEDSKERELEKIRQFGGQLSIEF